MWRGHAPGAVETTAAATTSRPLARPVSTAVNSDHYSADSFLKYGRRFHVGDCALFQAGNSSTIIGIICWFTPAKGDYLKLGVNRLYRPSDVKCGKGILFESAPNEVFYSFHKDEISAESLLHPCKVAFLHKGVELPSGISSFVCWRLYDTENKCLWWLSDTDFTDERKEEVDQLLEKTHLEMHAAVQSGGHSPKQLSGHLSAQQVKSSSDSVQNSSTSITSQTKGKKRGEKGDQGSESMKRERPSKADDGDSGHFRLESMMKAEIAKITDNGGLANNDAVEKLVQLMQLDKGEKKIDLAGRVLLVDVIAATDRNECLGRFVQLRGIPMLDEWLQEAHKGKNGDGSSPKEGDKPVEELLLALLRALDKLPVNLNALQTCNIGKSVNHLRSHKNMEIQKKARGLVDTWKKRVDAEMTKIEMAKLNDAKAIGSSQAISWPGKPGFSEVSIGANKRAASAESAVKSATNQLSTCKSLPIKSGHNDSIVKSNSVTAGSLKLPSILSMSVVTGAKDSQTKVGVTAGVAELPFATIKDEKSSSSSQSQNNSQSCSNDYAKAGGSSCKEDVRNPASGSTNMSKTTGGTSRNRRASNGIAGTIASGVQKDSGFSKSSSSIRNTTAERVLQSGLTVDRTVDVAVADHGTSQRLIVRLPNPGRSPAQSANGGSHEDLSITGSRSSSPGVSEKNEHVDDKTKLKSDVCRANSAADFNTQSWQGNDVKGVVGSDHGDRSSVTLLDEECSKSTNETGKATGSSKAAISSELKSGKPFEASLSPVNGSTESCVKYEKNALIESCVQYKENIDPAPTGFMDKLFSGMDTGKMSKSDVASPNASPRRKSPGADNPCTINEVKSKLSEDIMTQIPGESEVNVKANYEKHESSADPSPVQDDVKQNDADFRAISIVDNKNIVLLQETKLTADIKDGVSEDGSANKIQEKHKSSVLVSDCLLDCKRMARSSSSTENMSVDCVYENNTGCIMPLADGSDIDCLDAGSRKCEKEPAEESPCPPVDKQSVMDEGLCVAISTEQHIPPVIAVCPEDAKRNADNATASSASALTSLKLVDESKKEKSDDMAVESQLEPSDDEKKDHIHLAAPPLDRNCSSVISVSNGVRENLKKDVIERQSIKSDGSEEPPQLAACEMECSAKLLGFGGEVDEAAEVVCSPKASSVVVSSPLGFCGKHGFDLNEGLSVDEGHIAEPVNSSVSGCSSAVYLPNLTPFTVSPMSSSIPFHITFAAPAKGPFVPPETLLKTKGEGGWKGSAATSAFRPAEPRKALEMSLGSSDAPLSDSTAGKQCRLPLNIDLNVPDERVLEDIASQSSAQRTDTKSGVIINHDAPIRGSGGLDLDLNRVDEDMENGQLSASTSRRLEMPLLSGRPACKGISDGEANVLRDFDLNNGPGIEEVGGEHLTRTQHLKGNVLPFIPSLRMNGIEAGSLSSSWFPPSNSYSAVAIPSFLPDRGEQHYPVAAAPGAQRIMGSAAGGGTFGSDLYRGPVLSSSAMTFSPAAAFSYAGFPFGSSFPLASTSFSGGSTTYIDSSSGGPCFPALPTPILGPAGAGQSAYMRPYVISLPEVSTSGGSESSRKWVWQDLDLNAGPGSVDIDGREDKSSWTRQLPVTSSHAFTEEQTRMYQTAGGGLKRKEPEGGWDADRFTYKQPSWQ